MTLPALKGGVFDPASNKVGAVEPVPKLIDCALPRTVLGQSLAVFQAFSLVKLRISRLLSQKLKFWESLDMFRNYYKMKQLMDEVKREDSDE
jgi:hypothetical protein